LRENKIYIEAGAESPSGLEVMILKRGQGSEKKEVQVGKTIEK